MQKWIYGIISFLMLSNVLLTASDDDGDKRIKDWEDVTTMKYFALSPDCYLYISKDAETLQKSVKLRFRKLNDITTCENAEILYFHVKQTSNLLIFLPMDIEKNGSNLFKGMKVYGIKIANVLHEPKNIANEFEVLNYTYALPSKCGFDPKNFKVGLDVNVIHMLVTCENHLSFLRAQVNFEKSIVFTPKTWLVHFDQLPSLNINGSKCFNKIALAPVNIVGLGIGLSDSYVIRYCDTLISNGILTYFATKMHDINGYEKSVDIKIKNLNAEKIVNIFFMDSRSFVFKLDSKRFYIGTIDDEFVQNPNDIFLRQKNDNQIPVFNFEYPLVGVGRETNNISFPRVNDTFDWKFRAMQNPELQDNIDDIFYCGVIFQNWIKAKADLIDIQTILCILYILVGLELLLIFATLALFAHCIWEQRKRRRLHRERKARREEEKNLIKNDGHAPDDIDSKNAPKSEYISPYINGVSNDPKSEYIVPGMKKRNSKSDKDSKKIPQSEYISPEVQSVPNDRKSEYVVPGIKKSNPKPVKKSKKIPQSDYVPNI